MRVIFGIGNPGIRYESTRHNAGFLLLDYLAKKISVEFKESTGDYLEAAGNFNDEKFLLVKPVTYVNRCGIAAMQIFEKHNIPPEEFLVLCDDTNLKTFDIRVRLSGGDGGHNGLSSLIFHLATEQFPRIRIGIGNNSSDMVLSEYVLSEFSNIELEEYHKTFDWGSTLIEEFIRGGSKRMLEAYSVLMRNQSQDSSDQ